MNSSAKIVTIIGTRPQYIKLDKSIPQILVDTGQHYDFEMAGQFYKELKLPKPNYNLNCKSSETGKMLDKLRVLLRKLKPRLVMVYGDTNSTLAGALAAAYENIPVAHIEAGLRCGRMIPEEINRIIVDRLATYRFCPSVLAVENLRQEGIREHVYLVGDVMFDAMNPFMPLKRRKDYRKYILLTIHRQENQKRENLTNVLKTLDELNQKVIFPVHPGIQKLLEIYKLFNFKNIKFIKPVNYKQMLTLISNAKHVVTDSGGVMREAYWMQKPLTILRNECEYPEIIESGWGKLTGANGEKIINSIEGFRIKDVSYETDFQFGTRKKIKQILDKYV